MSEPVGMLQEDALGRGQVFWFNKPEDNTSLYAHPMRELTDEEIKQIFRDETGYEVDTCPSAILDFVRAILKKAREK
jgi:hypothetical protein